VVSSNPAGVTHTAENALFMVSLHAMLFRKDISSRDCGGVGAGGLYQLRAASYQLRVSSFQLRVTSFGSVRKLGVLLQANQRHG
jgi:hypothetical protein